MSACQVDFVETSSPALQRGCDLPVMGKVGKRFELGPPLLEQCCRVTTATGTPTIKKQNSGSFQILKLLQLLQLLQ